jgi:hypothetical protein
MSKKHLVKLPNTKFNENPFSSFRELFHGYRQTYGRSDFLGGPQDCERTKNSTALFVYRFNRRHYKDNKLPWLIALGISHLVRGREQGTGINITLLHG